MDKWLVLFDIDGTLVTARGLGRRSLDRAFHDLYGREGVFESVRLHGGTDQEIFEEGLRVVGQTMSEFPRAVERYLEHLRDAVCAGPSLLLPGVRVLLEHLRARGDVLLGLVTGNVRAGAALKLHHDGVADWFSVGAFGDDHRDRSVLLRLARARSTEMLGYAVPDHRVVYVGDTERDVAAARAASVVAVAVATGGVSFEGLAAVAPDHVLPSLEDSSRFLSEVMA